MLWCFRKIVLEAKVWQIREGGEDKDNPSSVTYRSLFLSLERKYTHRGTLDRLLDFAPCCPST